MPASPSDPKRSVRESDDLPSVSIARSLNLSAATGALPAGGSLHLSARTGNALKGIGLLTLQEFVSRMASGLGAVKGLGTSSLGELEEAVTALSESLDASGNLVRRRYAEHRGFPVFPLETEPTGSWLDALPGMAAAATKVCFTEPHEFESFARRYGLAGCPQMTLQEIGDALGLTRERVRQRQVRICTTLREAMLAADYSEKPFLFRDEFCEPLRAIQQRLDASPVRFWRESEFVTTVANTLQVPDAKVRPLSDLIIDVLSWERREVPPQRADRLEPIVARGNEPGIREVMKVADTIDRLLAEEPLGLDPFRLAASLNQKWPRLCTPTTASAWVRLCPRVEEVPDGRFRCLFSWLRCLGDKAYLVLLDAGEPLHSEKIAEEITRRQMDRARETALQGMKAKLRADRERFSPIGKSGLWKLTAWDHIDTRLIIDIVVDVLRQEGHPLHVDQLFDHVSQRRPGVARSSVPALLAADSRCALVGPATWALKLWAKD